MNDIRITVDASAARSFVLRVRGSIEDRQALNVEMANRLVTELQAHFVRKNAAPNKMGAPKTGFWQDMADNTQVVGVSADGGTVQAGDYRFNIQLFGGTVFPTGGRKCLTIPLVAEARGLLARDYELESGHRLFTIKGRNALFEKTDARATEHTPSGQTGRVRGANRSFTVSLAALSGIRPVYALARSATIPRDPDALPPDADLLNALRDQADKFTSETLQLS